MERNNEGSNVICSCLTSLNSSAVLEVGSTSSDPKAREKLAKIIIERGRCSNFNY